MTQAAQGQRGEKLEKMKTERKGWRKFRLCVVRDSVILLAFILSIIKNKNTGSKMKSLRPSNQIGLNI